MPWSNKSKLTQGRSSGLLTGLGGPVTPLVRGLLIANAIIFGLQLLFSRFFPFIEFFGLTPYKVAHGAIWQLFTYMFLHGGLFHLIFNLLGLWFFGGTMEALLGKQKFAALYCTAGVGAGICALALGWGSHTPLVGASGAIYGILIAYAMRFPYQPLTLLLFFILPVTLQARWMVAIFGAIDLFTLLSEGGLGQVAHLGGLLFGFLFMKSQSWAERRTATERIVPFRVPTPTGEEDRQQAQEEVNALLDKIAQHGEGALSRKELARLMEASKKLQP